jgi:mannose-6-phosphate isomerase-like protein (cupin superfamily)
MRRFLLGTLCTCVLLLGAARPAMPLAGQEHSHPKTGAYFSVNYADIKWEKILPDWGDASPRIAILRVDAKTQATHLLIWNPVAMHVPRHWHTANETHTILRGRYTFECDGKKEEMGPGSFNFIPSKMVHQAWLPDDGLVMITVDSAWDLNWVDGPPAPPKK